MSTGPAPGRDEIPLHEKQIVSYLQMHLPFAETNLLSLARLEVFAEYEIARNGAALVGKPALRLGQTIVRNLEDRYKALHRNHKDGATAHLIYYLLVTNLAFKPVLDILRTQLLAMQEFEIYPSTMGAVTVDHESSDAEANQLLRHGFSVAWDHLGGHLGL